MFTPFLCFHHPILSLLPFPHHRPSYDVWFYLRHLTIILRLTSSSSAVSLALCANGQFVKHQFDPRRTSFRVVHLPNRMGTRFIGSLTSEGIAGKFLKTSAWLSGSLYLLFPRSNLFGTINIPRSFHSALVCRIVVVARLPTHLSRIH